MLLQASETGCSVARLPHVKGGEEGGEGRGGGGGRKDGAKRQKKCSRDCGDSDARMHACTQIVTGDGNKNKKPTDLISTLINSHTALLFANSCCCCCYCCCYRCCLLLLLLMLLMLLAENEPLKSPAATLRAM
jgi:hypothetical protein